ncbi:hypothetical protein [Spirosoma linguale]
MKKVNIYPIISKSQKPHILQWVGLIVITFFFLGFLGLAIADVSWASFNITAIFYMIVLNVTLHAMFFKKIYYLSADKIVIADYKNEYISELPVNEIEKWNYYSNEREDCLVVSGRYASIVIDKYKYKNFEEILAFFTNSSLSRDNNLKSSEVKNEVTQEVSIYAFYLSLSIAFILNFMFWIITHSKSGSTEIQHFQGHIQTIETFSKSSSVRVHLTEYSSFSFRLDADAVKKYSLTNKAELIGKPVRIGIFKSDYDWKVNNKTIRMLDLNTTPYLDAVSFEFTKNDLYLN